jgi:transcriptional regulator with XRE-family HTH domain
MNNSEKTATEIQKKMGERIRTQRLALNLTISDLAKDTGLTGSTISQVERTVISPSISTLKKICDALKISVGELFEDIEEGVGQTEQPKAPQAVPLSMDQITLTHNGSPVVRKDRRKILLPSPGVRYYLLTPNLSGPLELIYNEFEPGAGTGPDLYTHPGVESGFVLSGKLEVKINSEVYILEEGDSITFNSSEPHLLLNVSDGMSTCVWANTPPWF